MFTKKPGEGNAAVPPAQPKAASQPGSPVSTRPIEAPKVTFRYVDRPDCTETFADTLSGLVFDGQSLRIEFAVSRLDEKKAGEPLTGRRYPVCRLVLPPTAAMDLINRMQQVASALAQAGLVKAQPNSGQ